MKHEYAPPVRMMSIALLTGPLCPLTLSTASPSSWSLGWIRSLTPRLTTAPTHSTTSTTTRMIRCHLWSRLCIITVGCHFQSVIKEEFSYYSPSGPKYEKFSKHLTVKEMVRLHFDPYISSFDLSKQPILVLDKVDYENQNFQTDSCFSFGWGSLLVYLVWMIF